MELNKEYPCKKIGSGAYGSVYSLDNLNLVVKIIPIYEIFIIELDIMSRLRHQNLMQILDFGIFILKNNNIIKINLEEHNNNLIKFGFIMEKAYKPLNKYKPKNKEEILDIIDQIKKGVDYLHKNKIAHCDIKTDNILVFDIIGKINIKITDFGISKYISKVSFDIEMDYYNLAFVIYYLITGVDVFDKEYGDITFYNMDHKQKIKLFHDTFTELGYTELLDFVEQCLNYKIGILNIKENNGYSLSIYKNNIIPDNKIKAVVTELNNTRIELGYDIILKMLQFYIINFNASSDINLTKFIICLYANLNRSYYRIEFSEYYKLLKTLKEKIKNRTILFSFYHKEKTFEEYEKNYNMFSEYIKLYNMLDNCNGIINNYSLFETSFRNINRIESLEDYNYIFKYNLEI